MYRVSQELSAAIDDFRTVVVPTRQLAQVLRFAHSAAQLRLGVPVWRSPQILTWTTWLERELRAATLESPALRGHSILSAPQERVLWQHATLTADGTLAMAQRVQRSATLARDYRLELPLRSQDGAMLRVAVAAFEAACRERRRVSVGLASDAHLRLIAERMAEPVWLAGFVRFTPQQQWFIELLAATGTHCRSVAHASVGTAHIRIAAVPDFATELALVAQWSRRLLEEDPQRRLLVVTPELERDRPALQRAFAATLAPRESTTGLVSRQARQLCSALRFDRGPPLAQRPAIQQALLALTVQPNAAEMTQLTALLHAPFLGTIAEERAKLDVWLRDTGRAQFENDELEQVLVNVPVELATAGSWLLQGLRLQRELLSPPRLTLRGWAERFGAVVDGYGWPGAGATQASGVIAQWRETLGELAGLDAVTGPERQVENSRDSALALLQELLRAGELPVNGDDAPISIAERSDLTERRQGPVVTYDGIWVLGMDASRWPQAARPDPLLPVAAQRQTGMPHASVSGRMMQARAGLAAWLDAGTQVVLSWASAQGEVRQQASPLLDSYAGAEAYESTEVEPSLAQRLATGQALERIGDEQGVPWSGNAPLPGGVKVLEEQGECAFRAYARLRLGAEPLPESAAGMDPRLRGSLLHHCLELLWAELRDSAGLARRTDAQLRQSILAAFDRALADSLQRLVLLPDVRVLARERNRTLKVIQDLFELERAREPFVVQWLEQRATLRVDSATLRLRIDRVDRLDDDSLAVMDYKSGLVGSLDLLASRPRPVQLLAYASVLAGESVTALALVQLRRPVKFTALADRAGRLPKQRAAPDDWLAQCARWQGYVEQLVRDFVAGNASVDPQPQACEYCHLPALCRIDALRIEDEPATEPSDE